MNRKKERWYDSYWIRMTSISFSDHLANPVAYTFSSLAPSSTCNQRCGRLSGKNCDAPNHPCQPLKCYHAASVERVKLCKKHTNKIEKNVQLKDESLLFPGTAEKTWKRFFSRNCYAKPISYPLYQQREREIWTKKDICMFNTRRKQISVNVPFSAITHHPPFLYSNNKHMSGFCPPLPLPWYVFDGKSE